MRTIEIEDNKFTCPMMSKEITDDINKTPNFVTCMMCKLNILGQIIDNKIYCNF